ncbi:hypothetical protein FQN51_002897 [Onygenales sp. PD_10]|nr:hypothetical protein FQN51_002897 [Onygenales sp. PD_10]
MEDTPTKKDQASELLKAGSSALVLLFMPQFTIKYGDTALTSIEAVIEYKKNAWETYIKEEYEEIQIMGGQQIAELGDIADGILAKYFNFYKSDHDWDKFRRTQEYNATWKRLADHKRNAQHN